MRKDDKTGSLSSQDITWNKNNSFGYIVFSSLVLEVKKSRNEWFKKTVWKSQTLLSLKWQFFLFLMKAIVSLSRNNLMTYLILILGQIFFIKVHLQATPTLTRSCCDLLQNHKWLFYMIGTFKTLKQKPITWFCSTFKWSSSRSTSAKPAANPCLKKRLPRTHNET